MREIFVQKLVGSTIYKDSIIHEWAQMAKEVTLRPGTWNIVYEKIATQ